MTDVTATCNACKTEVPGHIPGGCLNCYWIAAFKKVSAEAAVLRRDLEAATCFRLTSGCDGYVQVDDAGNGWRIRVHDESGKARTHRKGNFTRWTRDAALAEARRLEKAR